MQQAGIKAILRLVAPKATWKSFQYGGVAARRQQMSRESCVGRTPLWQVDYCVRGGMVEEVPMEPLGDVLYEAAGCEEDVDWVEETMSGSSGALFRVVGAIMSSFGNVGWLAFRLKWLRFHETSAQGRVCLARTQ